MDPPAAITHQTWTTDGHPIVDGKYIDLATGTTMTVAPNQGVTAGPPALEVYWHNRLLPTDDDADADDRGGEDHWFTGLVTSAFVDVTEYLRRVGEFLALGSCEVLALNATKYAVNVIVATELSREEVVVRLERCGLRHAR
ncbi:hypothetical protein PT974_02931 [Cladobotryum mycophilum]|uniref:Uncharacterized protein n=1 Tax=Cladobotryum mycophilum TaxID=491253 RepID=A0ABR0SZG2_9HYPO